MSTEITTDDADDAVDEVSAAADALAYDAPPPQPYRVKSRTREAAETILPPLILGGALIGFWYFVTYGLLDESRRFLLRPPHEVWEVGFADWDNFSEISSRWALARSPLLTPFGLAILTKNTPSI